ncbi:hypothetical protein MUN46_011460 [Mesosutterella sp. AGMB02718]|uniref:Uncharacterized protein n=1 Tax=Mesosutterella faecium TaxID=2925194 RepID=A0ABT7IQ87_9BURK|nr:hypothetical protein [Mesosutterella sp. AGMB02718]MDL2060330.1 hypothetical protein [Mesosutterella sp. AGMB02718]MDL2060553.1 hypothetical protein [Mesosutterella sp. AGMB02718]
MQIAVSIELTEDGGRLLFRNSQTRSLMFAYDMEKRADAARIVSQIGLLLRHFDDVAKKDTKTIDMFDKPVPPAIAAPTRTDPDVTLWQHDYWTESRREDHE